MSHPQLEWSDLNSHATPTPVVEEGRVYVHYGTYGTACLDTKTGQTLWQRRDLNCDHRVRPASSPIIDGDSLFLHFDGVDAQFAVALDKRNGKTQWLTNRDVQSNLAETLRAQGVTDVEKTLKAKPNDNRKAYATPTIIAYQGRRQLISPGAEVTFSYDPANGKELWRVRHPGWGWNVACRPIFENGLVYLTTGVSRHLPAVRPSGSGDITETHIAWSTKRSTPSIPSPLIVDDLLFMVSDEGFASCLEAKTGKVLWKERLRSGGDHWSCPLYAGGKIYFCGKKGVVSVVRAAREFQLLAENRLEASFIASPAVVEDSLILRSLTHLYCIAKGYERSPQREAAAGVSASKSKPNRSKPMSGFPLEVTGYYMGDKTRDDGEFETTFLIEFSDLDKEDWPTVTFTGEPFRSSFANLNLYHRVTLNLAEATAKK